MAKLRTLRPRIATIGVRTATATVRKRLSARERGYTTEWDHARKAFLVANPLCRLCEMASRVAAAREVDHIRPHRGNQELFWDRDNWQPICVDCHIAKTKAENSEATSWSGEDLVHPSGLTPSVVPLIMVCGPPASGKSTWVRDMAGPGDQVIDLDVIKSELSGLPLHSWDAYHVRPALVRRNELLSELGTSPARWPRAWFIISEPSAEWRAWWQRQLSPERIVVLEVPDEVCLARIAGDSDRAAARAQYSEAVMRWWNLYQRRDGEDRITG